MGGLGNIKVVVRCRPLNTKEQTRGAPCCIRIEGNQTLISQPTTTSASNTDGDETKAFTFDRSFWSVNPKDPHYASQDTVYEDLGQELLDHAFDGYNCCIFAYGQTGSGKSYTMLGYGDDLGIIPRACADLFSRISEATYGTQVNYQVEVSYFEIYNEKVRDLLNPRNKNNLKVREHPSLGPYVEDLSRLAVNSFEDINRLMNDGNKARTVAATNMNETSSRSHAVFTIFLTSRNAKLMNEKVSRISLVDLAGSERADSTGATGTRLKEGANINRSLTTLGKVIAALAEKSSAMDTRKNKKPKEYFIPYRDSILTWLLKDCLGGNSRTIMIAAISPADYEETLSTLRYADQAKRIKNKAVINEDPNAKLIRELKEEIQALRDTLMTYAPEEVEKITLQKHPKPLGRNSVSQLTGTPTLSIEATSDTDLRPKLQRAPSKEITFLDAFGATRKLSMDELVDQLKASQKLLDQTNQTWEQKLDKAQQVHQERQKRLETAMGVVLEKGNGMGILTPKQTPHIVNLNQDPLMSECLMYQLLPGSTSVGHLNGDSVDIRLSGSSIMDHHCSFENDDNGWVTLCPTIGARISVNGARIVEKTRLHNGYRIILGDYHVFRFNHPQEARKERDRRSSVDSLSPISLSFGMASDGVNYYGIPGRYDQTTRYSFDRDSMAYSNNSGGGLSDIVDWNSAKREALLYHYYNTSGINISRRTSWGEDEILSRTASSPSLRCSNDSLAQSIGTINNDTSSGHRHSGSHHSIDTGIFSSLSDIPYMDAMDSMTNIDLDSTTGIHKGENNYQQRQLWQKKGAYEEQIRLATLYQEQPNHIQDMETKLQRVVDDMQHLMENQRKIYESKISRLSSQISPNTAALLSPTEQSLASKVISQWRGRRYVLMAETMMVNAVFIKEANIIAKDLGKDVSYQYIVVHDNEAISSRSFWETSTPTPADEESMDLEGSGNDLELFKTIKPCLAVQVIDKKHRISFIWSIQEIKRRLEQMRIIYNFTDRPLSRSQIAWKDPFYQVPFPRFTLIGLASISLRHLLQQQVYQGTMEYEVDVFDRNTGKVMGRLLLAIAPMTRLPAISRPHRRSTSYLSSSFDSIPSSPPSSLFGESFRSFGGPFNHLPSTSSASSASSSSSSTATTTTQSDTNGGSFIRVGQQQLIQVQILKLSDLDETLFTHVHAQFSLSSFGNTRKRSDQDKVFATEPISGFGKGPVVFNYTQNLGITITSNTIMEYLTVELYGKAQLGHLNGIVTRHLEREKEEAGLDGVFPASLYGNPAATLATPPLSRSRPLIRSYTDDGQLLKERHHVVAYLQVCELGKDGEYSPVNVMSYSAQDQGCFYLRQGLQKQLKITMMHDSGIRLLWTGVTNVSISNVALLMDQENNDNSVCTTSEHTTTIPNDQSVLIPLHPNQSLEYHSDGTCILMANGPWDSSLHDFVHLNRITASQQRIRATLKWQVVCDKSTHPLDFTMDFYMKIHNRDLIPPTINTTTTTSNSNSSAILSYFSNAFYQFHRMSYKLRGIFSVHLSPPLTRQTSQLWRLNTANKYIRGEELLEPERCLRGVSLIQDYREATKRMRRRQQVLETRHTLALIEQRQSQRKGLMHHSQRQKHYISAQQDAPRTKMDSHAKEQVDRENYILGKILQLWTTQFGTRKEIVITQNPPPSKTTALPTHPSVLDDQAMKLTPRIHQLMPAHIVTKKGYLRLLQGDGDKWIKRWFTLRRPFIIVYEDQTEVEERSVIDLTSVHVEHQKEFGVTTKKPYTFTIQTTNNTFVLQAKDDNDCMDWVTKIDQFYPTDTIHT